MLPVHLTTSRTKNHAITSSPLEPALLVTVAASVTKETLKTLSPLWPIQTCSKRWHSWFRPLPSLDNLDHKILVERRCAISSKKADAGKRISVPSTMVRLVQKGSKNRPFNSPECRTQRKTKSTSKVYQRNKCLIKITSLMIPFRKGSYEKTLQS